MKEVDQLKSQLLYKRPKITIAQEDLLSTGSRLLNLACSGSTRGGFAKGKIYIFVGDSDSGKTFSLLTTMAEAVANINFEDYRLIYDLADPNGALMDIPYFFGKGLETRLERKSSSTVQEFSYNVDDVTKEGPCIYVLDDMDSLTTKEEDKLFQQEKKAHSKNREAPGTYAMDKAKALRKALRQVNKKIEKSRSILILVFQATTNVGYGAQFDPKKRSGGTAPKFFATLEIWTSLIKKLYKDVGKNGKAVKRQLGILAKFHVKKNRISGKDRSVAIPIYHTAGMDDTGSCIDFLLEEGNHWKKVKGKINAREYDVKMSKESLIQYIEKYCSEPTLHKIVSKVWKKIEDECHVERKKRYT